MPAFRSRRRLPQVQLKRTNIWQALASGNWNSLGFAIVCAFVMAWAFSCLLHRARKIDELKGRADEITITPPPTLTCRTQSTTAILS
jgi:hypothetical protein